jgi:hypothetical protein
MDDEIEKYLEENKACFDRFTFDNVFRFLLANKYTHEEAKDMILYNCSLSALTFQERIHNGYYKKIKVNEKFSKDLQELINKEFNSTFPKHLLN